MIELCLRQHDLASVAEAATAPIVIGRLAVRTVGVDGPHACAVARGNNTTPVIRMQPTTVVDSGTLVPDQRLIHSRSVDIATEEHRAIVFGDEFVSVVKIA